MNICGLDTREFKRCPLLISPNCLYDARSYPRLRTSRTFQSYKHVHDFDLEQWSPNDRTGDLSASSSYPLLRGPPFGSQKNTVVPAFLIDVVEAQFAPIEPRLNLDQ